MAVLELYPWYIKNGGRGHSVSHNVLLGPNLVDNPNE